MKNGKKILILSIVVCLLFSIAGVCASETNDTSAMVSDDASEIELSQNDVIEMDELQTSEENVALTQTDNDETVSAESDLNLLGEDSSTYSELSREIGSGGNIVLQHKHYTYDSGYTIEITIDNSVIDGNGAVIDMIGSDGISLFEVSASGVTIKNLTLKNGNYYIYGTAVEFNSDGIVENCCFVGCQGRYGGAINFQDRGEVINCSFVNCTAEYCAGAIWFEYEGSVENCNFTNNKAMVGGAIYMGFGNATGCNFVNNDASSSSYGGGAIFFLSTGNLTNCNFTDNKASFGGVVFFYEEGEVKNCNFANNHASDKGGVIWMSSGRVENSNFTNNFASNDGSAICLTGTGTVVNCNFTYNKATASGTVWISYGSVENCNFTNNVGDNDGGAIRMDSGSVVNCKFTNNKANVGGAVYFKAKGNLTDCNFVNNSASDGGAVYFLGLDGNSLDGNNHPYYYGLESSITNCNFTNNKANVAGGGAITVISNCTITDCNFVNNSASDGGAVFIYNIVSRVFQYDFTERIIGVSGSSIINCNFTNNIASGDGGAIFLLNNGTVTDCNFAGNNATSGSAIYFFDNSSPKTISNSIFLNNRADADALEVTQNENNVIITFTGKDNLLNAIYSNCEVTFTNVTYWGANGIANTGNTSTTPSRSNREPGQKITIEIYDSNGQPVDNVTLVTDINGQVVYYYYCILNNGNYEYKAYHPDDCYYTYFEVTGGFTLNDALGDDFNSLQTYIDRADENAVLRLIHNYTFTSGVDDNITLGIVIDKPLTIDGNGVVLDAKYSSRIFMITADDVVIKNIAFINGKIEHDDGGAIFWTGDNGTLTNCSFTENYANYGGAISWIGDNGTLSDCNFTENHAINGGGAIYLWSSICTINKCIFTGNDATGNIYYARGGGAIYWSVANGNITDSIFGYNKALSAGLNADINDTHLIFAFDGNENYINAIYLSSGNINFSNVTYWNGEWVNSDDAYPELTSRAAGQNITLEIYNSSGRVKEITLVTDRTGQAEYCYLGLMAGDYSYVAHHSDDHYYTYFEATGNFTLTQALGDAFITLQYYIDMADENSVLTLTHNYTFTDGVDDDITLGIVIDKPITIDGNGFVLDAKYSSRIFWITGDDVEIKNIAFINSKKDMSNSGGAIFWIGNNGTLTGCNFTDNSASDGGAVYWNGNYGTLDNCIFTRNKGGYGGAIAGIGENCTLTNCNFTDNTADYGGGAVYWWSSSFTISKCIFTGNDATGNIYYARGGGAIYWSVANGEIIDSIFGYNKALSAGLNANINDTHLTFAFDGNEHYINAIYLGKGSIGFSNVTYWDGEWVNSDDAYPELTSRAAGQNITLEIYNSSGRVKEITLVTDVFGQAEYCYMDLVDGNYSFVAYHPDDRYYTYISTSGDFTCKHIKPNVTFAEDFVMEYRDGSAWNITLLGAGGNPISGAVVKVGIAGKVYNRVTDDLGVAGLPINLVPGVYSINATYDGAGEYGAVFVNGTITVNRAVSTLTAEDITLAYRNGSWIVTLTGAEGVIPKAGIKFGILGKVYTLKTDDRGVASLPINLSPGTYSVNATFDGNAKHKSAFVNATVTVERATATISSEDLTMHYKDGSEYAVTVTDASGAVLAGITVRFSFGTKSYSIKTDANGVAALPINLNVGEYTVNAVVDDARYVSEVATNTIAVTDYDVVPVASDINMTYQDGTNYEVQLTTSDGTPFAVADLVVKITILGKTYSIKTDAEGIAKLPINLKAGTYVITAEYNGKQVNSTVVVNKV